VSYALQPLPEVQLAPLAAAYARAGRRRAVQGMLGLVLVVALLLLAAWFVEASPATVWDRRAQFLDYFSRLLTLTDGPHAGGWVWQDIGEWMYNWPHWLALLGDTLLMAYVGTVIGAIGGFAAGVLGAANLVRSVWLRWTVKRLSEFCRTVPELVFALLFVYAFGLGPLPGVLAIAIHTIGALGKQFSEVVENVDMKPVEGVVASGGSWTEMVRFAVVPQVLPGFLSYSLLRFEINVRSAAVLGFVGAGGIGHDLIVAIRRFYYNDVAALLVLIILTVVIIDTITGRLRRRLMEAR
jgi:phosphonate transport system permease protein